MRGHLVKRSQGSWSIVLDLGRDPTSGRRRQSWVSVKGTKKEAEKRLAELIHQADTGSLVMPGKLTLGDFLRRWLRDYAATNVRGRTLEGYRTILEGQTIPAMGSILLTELRPAHLQEYYGCLLVSGRRDRRPGGLSARTVLSHHRVLSEALSHAVQWGLAARNVAEAVKPPRTVKKTMKALDAPDVRKLLEAARGTMWYPVLHLAVNTGLRRSELLGLRWRDVDLDMATLSVVQVMHRLRGQGIVFLEPKTAKGRRQVALSPSAALELRAYRERQEADMDLLGLPLTENTLVFCQPDGKPLLPDSLSHAFDAAAKRAGLSGVRLHDLRHTHASLMLKAGIHPKVVSERLGHATIAITLDTYSHVLPGLQQDAVRRFEEVMAR